MSRTPQGRCVLTRRPLVTALVLAALVALAAAPASADEVHLETGIVLDGEIISVDDEQVVIELSGLNRRIAVSRDQIAEDGIVGGPSGTTRPDQPPVGPDPTVDTSEPGVERQPVEPPSTEEPEGQADLPPPGVDLETLETPPGAATELGTISSFRAPASIRRRGAAGFTALHEGSSRILYGGEVLQTGESGGVSVLFINLLRADLGAESMAQLLVSPFSEDERLFRVKLLRGEMEAAKPQGAFLVDVGETRVRGEAATLRAARVGDVGAEVLCRSGRATMAVWGGPVAELEEDDGVRIASLPPGEAGPRFEMVATGEGTARVRPGGANGAVALDLSPGARAQATPLESGAVDLSTGDARVVLPSERGATVRVESGSTPVVSFLDGAEVGLLEGLDAEVAYGDGGAPTFPFADGSRITVHEDVRVDLHNPWGGLDNGARFELAAPLPVELFSARAPYYRLQLGLISILLGPDQPIVLGETDDGEIVARNPEDQRQVVMARNQRARVFLQPEGTIRVVTDDRAAELPPMSPPSVALRDDGEMVVDDGTRRTTVAAGEFARVVGGPAADGQGPPPTETVVSADYRFRDIPHPGRESGGIDLFRELPGVSPSEP